MTTSSGRVSGESKVDTGLKLKRQAVLARPPMDFGASIYLQESLDRRSDGDHVIVYMYMEV